MALSRYNPYGMSLRNAMDQLLTQAFVNRRCSWGRRAWLLQ